MDCNLQCPWYRKFDRNVLLDWKERFSRKFSLLPQLSFIKWTDFKFPHFSSLQRNKVNHEVIQISLARDSKLSNIFHHKGVKYCYKRYASLFFCIGMDDSENELMCLLFIHRVVEGETSIFQGKASNLHGEKTQCWETEIFWPRPNPIGLGFPLIFLIETNRLNPTQN